MTSASLPAPARAARADDDPSSFEGAFARAVELQTAGRTREALFCYQRALAFRPGSALAYNNLGAVFLELGRQDECRRHYEAALALRPRYARPHLGLATLFQGLGAYGRSIEHYRKALELEPDQPTIRFNLGLSLQFAGMADEAAACFRLVQESLPDQPQLLSQYLLCLNYTERSGEDLLAEHRRFGARYPLPATLSHGNDPDPERPLRIGYLAVDFRQHLGSYFLAPILERADRRNFSIHCYSALPAQAGDTYTARFQSMADSWTPVHALSDAELDLRIRADRIDVLVDLAAHSGLNRLPALAGKPAPVQITWLGYPNTTGLRAIDARLVDSVTDPEGSADRHASERLVRLPVPFLCFAPPEDAPDVGPPPFADTGAVTFGSLNTLAKHTPAVFRLWARILAAVPGARLMLKDRSFDHAEERGRIADRFADAGIAADRLILLGWSPGREGHLARYQQIDIALDPFPYNGTITTCDALWMGVPMVTLLGERHAARVGASLLHAVGLDELVATDPDDYVARAVALAGDPARLSSLRAGMRDRLRASPLCDAERFTRTLETVYRDLWRGWCTRRSG